MTFVETIVNENPFSAFYDDNINTEAEETNEIPSAKFSGKNVIRIVFAIKGAPFLNWFLSLFQMVKFICIFLLDTFSF